MQVARWFFFLSPIPHTNISHLEEHRSANVPKWSNGHFGVRFLARCSTNVNWSGYIRITLTQVMLVYAILENLTHWINPLVPALATEKENVNQILEKIKMKSAQAPMFLVGFRGKVQGHWPNLVTPTSLTGRSSFNNRENIAMQTCGTAQHANLRPSCTD